ncbi:hypothetical protein AAFF_G00327120 [Aldrovandia affinis]|uniref:Uncharacterized protein n=1 Tax=Aldrovandia affinis TaxID=143900 RepID=A0AAD7X2B9_9TELE|nr:hypothetical protein AAFF_G00327120 [Aldrovandia affinis]
MLEQVSWINVPELALFLTKTYLCTTLLDHIADVIMENIQKTQVPARISACLPDISAWMSTHHLKLNLGKTELLFLPAKGSPMIDASITVEGSIVPPSQSARSLGVTLDNQLLGPHCSDHSNMPILPPQHPEDLTIPHPRGHTTPGPGPGDLTSGLLQSLAGRPTGFCHQATATSPECCCSSGVQPAEVHPCHPSTLLSALAPHHSMHQIQITGACFSSGYRFCSPIPPVTHHSLHPSQTPPLHLLWQTDSPIPPGAWQPLLAVSSLLCPDPSLVERPSAIGQDCGITWNLPQETQNPPFQTPLPLNSVHLANCHQHCLLAQHYIPLLTPFNKKKNKKKY